MTSSKRLIFTFIAVLIQGIVYSQNLTTDKGKILTKQQLTEDYNILYSSLINYHPNPFLYISESNFKTYYETQKLNIPDKLSELEFHYLSRKLISQIKCGHTFAQPSVAWYASVSGKNVQLPFNVKNIDGRLFINNTIDENFDFGINDELLSINNTSVKDILQQMSLMESSDGFTHSLSNALIERRFRTYLLFITGVQQEFLIEFKTSSGDVKKVIVQPTNKKLKELKESELPPNFNKVIENNWSFFSFDPTTSLGYLKINNFSDRKEYKKYYRAVFKFLKQKPGAKIIIDIRDNPGGYFRNGNKFLTYLTPGKFELNFQKPKKVGTRNKHIHLNKWSRLTKIAFSLKPSKHKIKGQSTTTFSYKPSKHLFTGKVYVITNGITFSQAALVAAQLKEYGAIFFGEETGGAEMGCNGILNYDLVLPNSELKVTIPSYQVKSNLNKGVFGFGVKPNYPITRTLEKSNEKTLETVIETILNDE